MPFKNAILPSKITHRGMRPRVKKGGAHSQVGISNLLHPWMNTVNKSELNGLTQKEVPSTAINNKLNSDLR